MIDKIKNLGKRGLGTKYKEIPHKVEQKEKKNRLENMRNQRINSAGPISHWSFTTGRARRLKGRRLPKK